MNNKNVLLKRLKICDFVLTETALYLDTHPEDKDALDYYNKHLNMRNETLDEYTRKYGTILRDKPQSEDKWDWVDNPWPWESEWSEK